jgi:hypothetical protein
MKPLDEHSSLANRAAIAILAIVCAYVTAAAVLYPGAAAIFWLIERSYGYAFECFAIAWVAPAFAWAGLRRGLRRGDTKSRRRQRAATWYAVCGLIVGIGWSLAAIFATGI